MKTSKFITFQNMTLQQAYIIKHALRDKVRDEAEEKLLQTITDQIKARKEELGIGVSKNATSI